MWPVPILNLNVFHDKEELVEGNGGNRVCYHVVQGSVNQGEKGPGKTQLNLQ